MPQGELLGCSSPPKKMGQPSLCEGCAAGAVGQAVITSSVGHSASPSSSLELVRLKSQFIDFFVYSKGKEQEVHFYR